MTRAAVRKLDRRLSVAPMMDWTDRHCRHFHRLLAPGALLYTEMVHAGAVLHGDVERHLGFGAAEHPVALQLGGCEPAELARAARIGAAMGYDEINLNCGCPSDRVQRGRFGACLMAEPERVADAWRRWQRPSMSVTVKCRIGIDDSEEPTSWPASSPPSRRRLRYLRRACPQGLAPWLEPQGEPRDPATSL